MMWRHTNKQNQVLGWTLILAMMWRDTNKQNQVLGLTLILAMMWRDTNKQNQVLGLTLILAMMWRHTNKQNQVLGWTLILAMMWRHTNKQNQVLGRTLILERRFRADKWTQLSVLRENLGIYTWVKLQGVPPNMTGWYRLVEEKKIQIWLVLAMTLDYLILHQFTSFLYIKI
jgi:hypothetical protein